MGPLRTLYFHYQSAYRASYLPSVYLNGINIEARINNKFASRLKFESEFESS